MKFHHNPLTIAASAALTVSLIVPPASASLWKQVDLNPRVSIREMYDDNVTFVKDNKVDDFITKVLLGFGFDNEGKAHTFSMEGSIEQQIFADNHSFNNTVLDLGGKYSKTLSRYSQVYASDDFSHSEEPRSFEDAFGRASGRYSIYRNTLVLGYAREFSDQLSWDSQYRNAITDYSVASRGDALLNALSTGIKYAFSSRTEVTGYYEYSRRDFDPGDSAQIHELAAILRRYLTRQLYFDVKAGLDIINDFFDDTSAYPLVEISLTNDIDETTQGGISLTQKHTVNEYSQDVFDSWRISAKFAKDLSARLRAGASAFLGEGEYDRSNVEEKLKGAGIGLDYELTERANLNLSYAYTDSDPTTATNGYTKNVVTVGVDYKF